MKPKETFTDIVIIGTKTEIDMFAAAAKRAGRLVWASGPHLMGGTDLRIRVAFRLTPTP